MLNSLKIAFIAAVVIAVAWLLIANAKLKSDIVTLTATQESLKTDAANAIAAAKSNKALLDRADAERQRQLDAVRQDFEAYKKLQADLASMDAEIDSKPEEDGPLAPILKNWRPPQ